MSYEALPSVSVNGDAQPTPSPVEVTMMARSTRWVIFLCLVQLLIGALALSNGGILLMVLTVIFVSVGLAGARKQRVKLLVAHFVFSLVLYIFSLIGIIALVVYCHYCSFWLYIIGFLFVLFQAIGLRHSRNLIFLVKKYGPKTSCCASKTQCGAQSACNETPQEQQPQQQQQQQTPQEEVSMNVMPSAPMMAMPMGYAYPQQMLLPPQYSAHQYIPLQNMRGGIPLIAPPQYVQQVPQQQQNPNMFPVVYRQM